MTARSDSKGSLFFVEIQQYIHIHIVSFGRIRISGLWLIHITKRRQEIDSCKKNRINAFSAQLGR
ncbi:hypothetical protein LX82_00025 [Celeribacter halophilus]|uniref:Uncharacterized protein n=1 Tax=Celeribacter halophilus TaxID=576117 RepID=A0A1I3MIP6_9RHOB|nr:hypothetical protein LX82_00025 [Celeribacter halophilus]SFI96869.1 hypothetical protein SAMN04488138_10125 [Celeribacter halophilus]